MDEQKDTSQQSLLDVDLDAVVAEGKKQNKKNKKKIVIAAIVALCMLAGGIAIVLAREEAARAEAYNEAVLLSESGQYTKAIEAFTALGNYKDSAEQLDKNIEKNEEVQCKTAMATSLKKAYTQLKALPDSYSFKKEMLAICEPYIPYCGTFTYSERGDTVSLDSDFGYSNGMVFWNVAMPTAHDKMGLYVKSNKSDMHNFFVDADKIDLKVRNMQVKYEHVFDSRNKGFGEAQFRNKGIIIRIWAGSKTYWERSYIKE